MSESKSMNIEFSASPKLWNVTHDMWHIVGVKHFLKFQLPSFYGLGVTMFSRFGGIMNDELFTKVLIDQPRLHLVFYKFK